MLSSGWSCVEESIEHGVTSFQWDGGVDLSIHPHVPRQLPGIGIPNALVKPFHHPSVRVSVVADGALRTDATHDVTVVPPRTARRYTEAEDAR